MTRITFTYFILLSAWINCFTTLVILIKHADRIDKLNVPFWLIIFYFILHLPFIFYLPYYFIKDLGSPGGLAYKIWQNFNQLKIPSGAKLATIVVLIGNFICITLGYPVYPFYDVGMFRWHVKFEQKPGTVYVPKYYYWEDEEYQILDLRKEGYFYLADHFDLRHTHTFTFALTYHNKSQEENFIFLAEEMAERGIDTLWVGLHIVNYKTREVFFDPDIFLAVEINETEEINRGPIYIPHYQIEKYENRHR